MGIIVAGKVFEFWTFALMVILTLFYVWLAKRGVVPVVRGLLALDAIDEVVGRAAEMGRPVVFSTGWGGGGLYSDRGPSHMAGISVLDYTAKIAAKTGAKLITVLGWPEMVPVAEDTVRQSYISEGKLEVYDPNDVRFLSSYQHAYTLGYMGTLLKEKAAANILIGSCWAEVLTIIETGSVVGAVQIGGLRDVRNLPMMVAVCDYFLIGDELFAASAYLNKEPTMIATIGTGDLWKWISVVGIIIGALLAFGNIDWSWLLKL